MLSFHPCSLASSGFAPVVHGNVAGFVYSNESISIFNLHCQFLLFSRILLPIDKELKMIPSKRKFSFISLLFRRFSFYSSPTRSRLALSRNLCFSPRNVCTKTAVGRNRQEIFSITQISKPQNLRDLGRKILCFE